jgi:hypothetical protein
VLQSDLWRELGASSREGSRVSIKLEEKGLIRREKELQEGRWTYRLYPKRLPASIETIIDCPCLLCPDNARCDPTTAISPKSCPKLTDWILNLGKEKTEVPTENPLPTPSRQDQPNVDEEDKVDAESLDS